MIKKSLLFAMSMLFAGGMMAETLSPEAALQRAQKSGRRISGVNPTLSYTAKTQQGAPAVYVFNNGGDGSLILSASTKAIPVLGYTDSGSFDPDNIPPQLEAWLNEYASQIAYAEENNLQPSTTDVTFNYPSDWTYIAPLVKTTWDQTKPYNGALKSSSYATGCVATALAQVMKYHNYPEIGHGSITYTDAYRQQYSMNFDEKPFQWDLMLNSYSGDYTQAQADAVAYLMKACGYSTNMSYGSQSGTQVERAATALIQYFGYDDRVLNIQRYSYTLTEWATTLYNQLKNYGPVIYSGHSLSNLAHAFVCDGYDGQGYFHINWGWSGMCDGFYSLDALNPTVQGTGGSNYGGYNFSQGMIINITPSEGTPTYKPQPEMTLLGSATATNVSSVITFEFTQGNPGNLNNTSLISLTPVLGFEIENTETGQKVYSDATSVYFYTKLTPNSDLSWIDYGVDLPTFTPGSFIDPKMRVRGRMDSQLPDGRYKMTLVWKDKRNQPDWTHFISTNGCFDYVYVTKTDGKYTIENVPMARIVIDSAEVITPLYMRNPCQIKFTVSNPTDFELSQSIVPVLFYTGDGKASFEGDSQVVTVGPHETITATLIYTFSNAISGGTSPTTSTPREYILGAYDYNMMWDNNYLAGVYGEAYYGDLGTVTMKRSTSNPAIRSRFVGINNAVEEGPQPGIGYVYGINEFSKVELGLKVEGTSGFIATPLSAVVYECDPATGNIISEVLYEKNFEGLLYVASGETVETSTILDLTGFETSKMYRCDVIYILQNTRMTLGTVRFSASSGVDEIVGAEGFELTFDGMSASAVSDAGNVSITVFDLGGKAVAAGIDRVALDALSKGIYMVRGADEAGNVKTIKIIK